MRDRTEIELSLFCFLQTTKFKRIKPRGKWQNTLFSVEFGM